MSRSALLAVLSVLIHGAAIAGAFENRDTSARTHSEQDGEIHVWFGPMAGWSSVLMTDPNNLLKDTEEYLRLWGGPRADLLDGGIVYGAQVTMSINRVILGAEVSAMSLSGSLEFSYTSVKIEERIEPDLLMLLGTVGYRLTGRSDYHFDVLLGAGYGFGSATYSLDLIDRLGPSNSRVVRGDFKGGKLVLVPQGALRIPIGSMLLELKGGYRFANLGVLRGPVSVNGEDVGEQSLQLDNRDVEFDYSGFLITAGVSLVLR